MSALDPRVKLIGVIAFSVVTASLETLPALAAALVLSLGLVALARMRLRDFLMRLAVVNLFIVFLWLFLPWSMSGERLFSLGPLQISDQGVSYSLLLTVRSNALVIALMALMSSTSIVAITHAMSSLRVPDKLAALFFFTYRYIQEISGEYTRLSNAMKVRCFVPGTGLHTYRSYAWLVGMLLVNSYERACRVRTAMVLRGFNGRFACLEPGRITGLDMACLGLLLAILAGLLYADL